METRQYRGYRTAGIRLTEELIPEIVELQRQREAPGLLALHEFDKAHTLMLVEQHIIPREAGIAILQALRELDENDARQIRRETGAGLHAGEVYLIRKLGEQVGGHIHVGRSSGDLTTVSIRMVQRDYLLDVLDKANNLRATLLRVAEDHLETVMPSHSHGQHAQPTTYGHVLLSWCTALGRDVERLRSAYGRVNLSPAGAVIGTGSDFPIDRTRTAELLGFDAVNMNTFDAIFAEDVTLECMGILTILHANLARWSDDLMLWASQEHGTVDFPDRFCGTSSIMAHKKNPYPPQEIKGSFSETVGSLVTAIVIEKGPTGLAIADRFYSYEAQWHAFAHAIRSLQWMEMVIESLKVRGDLMRERAGAFWGTASDLVSILVKENGLPWRTAHQIVAILVRQCIERGIGPHEVSPSHLDEAAREYIGRGVYLKESLMRQALDPTAAVKRRCVMGGPSPNEVQARLCGYRELLDRDKKWVCLRREALAGAAQRLKEAIDHLILQK